MKILAVDPGCQKSAWCLTEDYRPLSFGKEDNGYVLRQVLDNPLLSADAVVIEMVASYGLAVGREVFETVFWIGRFFQKITARGINVQLLYRRDVKTAICHSTKAKDANIRQALIDRFADHDLRTGKGTKANPDWFYGFAADVWQAYAVAVTWLDKRNPDF